MKLKKRKAVEIQNLSITSLLDALTIILVFLIKNVSSEAARVSEERGITYPTTITNDKLLKNAAATPIKIFRDKILVGTEALEVGKPGDVVSNKEKREGLKAFLDREIADITLHVKQEPCLIVQADNDIPCAIVSEIVLIATAAGYNYVYFATIEDELWLQKYNVSSTR